MNVRYSIACWLSTSLALMAAQTPDPTRGFETTETDEQPADASVGTTHALLVAIQDYPQLPALRTPRRDAIAFGTLLNERYGVANESLRSLFDQQATRASILDALQSYRALDATDSLILYYAGHGSYDGSEGYWQPHDADRHRQSSWISNAEIKAELNRLPVRHVLVVADSCFAGSLTRGSVTETPYVAEMAQRASREVITSGDLQEVSDGGYEGHSLFAYFLLRELGNREATFLSTQLYNSVVAEVFNDGLHRQTPQFGRIPGQRDQRGQFVFRPRAPANPSGGGWAEAGWAANDAQSVTENVPLGWRLPAGIVEKKIDGEYLYHKRSGTDLTPMVLIKPGGFRYQGDAGQLRRIATPFLIDQNEVTVERFKHYVREVRPDGLATWNEPGFGADQQPVVGLSLRQALDFAAWAGKYIPDEVHWEYAAAWQSSAAERPGAAALQGRLLPHPWGERLESANLQRTEFPPPVGSCAEDRSPWGVLGMGSGVREWCVLPVGDPERRNFGVLRGATQLFTGRRDLAKLRSFDRDVVPARNYAATNIGFRCIVFLER